MLIAHNINPQSLSYRKAIRMMVFKEPREMCLGYTDQGTDGLGSGIGFATLIAQHMAAAIVRGLGNMEHFEELGILNKGIGRDRISDAACTILKPQLVSYTQQIAWRHGLSVTPHVVYGAVFDPIRQRFDESATADVLTNPLNGRPLILTPKQFLRDLPTLNDRAWFEHHEDEMLREDLSYEVLKKVRKTVIVDRARRRIESVRAWAKEREASEPQPYDESSDPEGVILWEPAANEFTAKNPISLHAPDSHDAFIAVVETIIAQFRLFIEMQGGWYLLWDGVKDKPEKAAQLALYGIARNYCEANGIVVSREVELGRGPVDFTFTNGYKQRAHLEAKKTHNGKFWNGLDAQLPSYMESDDVGLGWFLAVRYREGKQWDERDRELPDRVRAAAKSHGRDLRLAYVDARRPLSASKVRSS